MAPQVSARCSRALPAASCLKARDCALCSKSFRLSLCENHIDQSLLQVIAKARARAHLHLVSSFLFDGRSPPFAFGRRDGIICAAACSFKLSTLFDWAWASRRFSEQLLCPSFSLFPGGAPRG
jgi:hypothetical protein